MIISLDTETTGLEEKDRPFCATISGRDFNIYTEDANECAAIVKDATKILYQNSKFDMRMLSHWGINPTNIPAYDCEIMSRILRNDHLKYSLDAQAKRMGMAKSTAVDEAIKAGKHYETRRDFFGAEYKVPRYDWVDRETLKKYALLDSRLTYLMGMNYLEKADASDLRLMNMESELTPVCYRMERRGMQLNKDYTLQGYHYEKNQLAACRDRWRELTGSDFTNSAQSISKHLTISLPTTAAGNPSLTDDVIEEILVRATDRDKELLKTVRDIRGYDKRISTYYTSYLNFMDGDGVIHADMRQAGTRTGRFSYRDPNLQNIPAEENSTARYVIRGCFMPRPGNVFVSIDYMAQEYRIMADYAGEEDIIKAVMEGKDFHQVTADMFGVTRKQAKTVNFLTLYGGGPQKLADTLGIPLPEATRLRTKYFSALPNVEKLIDDVIATGRGRGFVYNWLGRKLYSVKEHCYALPNHLIQSSGADTMKVAMINIASFISGKEIEMVLAVHDELVFEMPEALLPMVKQIQEIMETVYESRNGMRLKTSASFSRVSLAKRDMEDLHV